MNFRIKILAVFVPLCLLLCFMSNTYSRYVADTTGNVKMSFAQWQILVNDEDITNNTSSSVTLNPIIEQNEYVESNKLAPSSTGYFDISIDPTNVDVAFNYTITLDVVNENIPDLMITKYAILDKNYTEGQKITYKNIEDNKITESVEFPKIVTPSDEIITPQDEIATSQDEIINYNFEPFVVRVYFEWYEGANETMKDEDDTNIGTNAENIELEINAKIKFEQKISE